MYTFIRIHSSLFTKGNSQVYKYVIRQEVSIHVDQHAQVDSLKIDSHVGVQTMRSFENWNQLLARQMVGSVYCIIILSKSTKAPQHHSKELLFKRKPPFQNQYQRPTPHQRLPRTVKPKLLQSISRWSNYSIGC